METTLFSKIVEINPRVNLQKGNEYPFVEMAEVDQSRRYAYGVQNREYKGGGTKFINGDTIFARITPCLENGKIAQFINSKQIGFGSTEFFVFRAIPRISDPSFIYYLSRSDMIKKPAEKIMSGASGRQRADINSITNIEVPDFTLLTQKRIAAILSAFDDLIENNLRRIKILEEMAQNLYREWFVNFRFPGHKKVRFVDSPLGRIPEGWEVRRLDEVCLYVVDGDWIETKDQGGSDFRLIQISNIGLGNFVEKGNYRFINDEVFKRLHCTEVLPNDLLIARMPKPIGRAWLVRKMPWRMITAVDIAIARPKSSNIQPLYLMHFWNQPSTLEMIEKMSSGTTRLRITRRELCAFPIPVPNIELQQIFVDNTMPMSNLIYRLQDKNDTLRQTRDLLLPKLISGEVDVSELDISVPEEVAI
jgi:type I restriction enzyme, S subunit